MIAIVAKVAERRHALSCLPMIVLVAACSTPALPPDVKPHRDLARRYLVEGRLSAARQQLDLALALRPDDEDALFLDGAWRLMSGDPSTAEAVWTELTRHVRDEPLRSRVETGIGLTRIIHARPDSAADHLEIALDLDPHNGLARDLLQVAQQLESSAQPPAVDDLAHSPRIRELVE
ncbi:MAG: hypothetical protein U1E76_18415 [Planctomycetota bacterium]